MYSHITLRPIPKKGKVLGKGQFGFSYHITEVLIVSQGQFMRVAKGGQCSWFCHKITAVKVPLVPRPGKEVGGKEKERRTAKAEDKGGESMREGEHWRRIGRSEAFQPITNSGTCPNLGLACVSVACLTAMALGTVACLQETSWLYFPYPRWAGVEAKAGSFYCWESPSLLGVCEHCKSLLATPTSFPWCQPFPTPASAAWAFRGFMSPRRATGSLEAAGAMLWLNPWGPTPTIPCILRLHRRRLMDVSGLLVTDGSNDKKNKMLHHILAKGAQKDNSGGCLSPSAFSFCVPMHGCL